MGVHNLWELLSPVGRRVSVETLAGKKLAIDASIWMVQFMKAMRDEKGEMVRNAHILGFFRRICKLLFLRTKPVFVFDGATPALKRRTVIARRRQRENAQSKIRKTAEKLLLNHLRTMRAKEMAVELQKQRRDNDGKGKKPMVEEREMNAGENVEKGNDEVATSFNQEMLDEMLAASLAAEESEGVRGGGEASTSGAAGVTQDEVWVDDDDDGDGDGDEEMIIPEMQGDIDPAILASLPPSMQLDLLVQMRERLMAENRQKYQKVKKAPARFSELQIESYLKTVAFRREIDGVQKSAAGRGRDGVQISRIASESNREFIFSSSFTGDKEAFISAGQDKIDASQSQSIPMSNTTSSINTVTPTKRSATATPTKTAAATPTKRSTEAENETAFSDDVETYLDERGRVRLSRHNAMGMRMTRDLQSNLALMKKIEEEREDSNQVINKRTTARNLADVLANSSERIYHEEITERNNDGLSGESDKVEDPVSIKETPIVVSFVDNCDVGSVNEEDQLFASLVAGDPVIDFPNDNAASKESLVSTSDCEWEEGVIEDRITDPVIDFSNNNAASKELLVSTSDCEWEERVIEDRNTVDRIEVVSDGGDVDWEDGQLNFTSNVVEKKDNGDEKEIEWEEDNHEAYSKFMSYADENRETASKGAQEEEAEFQEAIRRSLKDSMVHSFLDEFPKDTEPGLPRDIEPSVCAAGKLPDSETPAMETIGSEQMSDAFVNPDVNKSDQVNDLVGVPSGNVSSYLAGKDSLADLHPERLLVCESPPLEHVIQAAVDGLSFESGEVGNAKDSVTELDDLSLQTNEVEKISVSVSDSVAEADESIKKTDIAPENQGQTKEPSLMYADEKNEDMGDLLNEEIMFLANEREELGNEQRKLERNADSVSSEMFIECQELLQMFGLPYIIAPMEAEAQCAFMELSNLVDGVVTDDSDAFLFGARTVYKNIFDDRKYVETYLMKDIESELGLNREKLIDMALLLGSDYTEGVSGIGIVNAIEVVNAFPEKNGLQEFREWIESPDPTILGKLGNSKSKVSMAGESCNSSHSEDELTRQKQIFMNKHRNVSKNWHIPSTFPSDAVISAYVSPQVDKSTESFSWGKPDLSVLRKLCWEKFSWGTSKADDLLLPVLKEYNKHETQLRLEAFYTFNERFAKIRSKRIKKAVKGIAGDKSTQLMDETIPQQPGSSRKRRKVIPSENEANQSDTSNQNSNLVKPTPKKLKGKQTKENTPQNRIEECSTISTTPNTKKVVRGRGLKARGKGQVRGKGREENNISSDDDAETSHEKDGDLQYGGVSEPHQMRRSGRVRKTVTYNEFDDLDVEIESRVSEDVEPNESFEGEAVNVDQTDGNILSQTDGNILGEDMDIELEDDLFIGETELTYDADEMDTSPTDGNPIEDHLDQNESPKEDYLQSGGGFCVDDEDEQNQNADHASGALEESIPENPGKSNSPSQPVITPMVTESVISPLVNEKDLIDVDEIVTDTRIAPERSLRAMPNLRRKKRKQT